MNNTNQKRPGYGLATAIAVLLLSAPYAAHATDYTWNGKAGDSQWANSNNWTPRGVPGAQDSATIGGTSDVQVPGNVTLKNLRLGESAAIVNDGDLSVTGWASSDGIIAGNGDLNIPAGASATINLGATSRDSLVTDRTEKSTKGIKFGKITNKGKLRINIAASVNVELGDVANAGDAVLSAEGTADDMPVQFQSLKNANGTVAFSGAGAKGRAFAGTAISNSGKMLFSGAHVLSSKGFSNEKGATMTLADGSLLGSSDRAQTLENAGILEVPTGDAEIQMGWRNNGGHLHIGTGHLRIAPPAGNKVQQFAGTTTIDDGTLEIVDSVKEEKEGGLQIRGGVLDGSGTIDANVTIDGGAINVGHSPGLMIILGNFTQTANGLMNMEIWGPIPGVLYDQLRVSGVAYFDGTLNIEYGNNYAPGQSSFLHISYGFYVGQFATVNFYNTNPSKYYRVIYSSSALYSQVLASAPPGAMQAPTNSPSFNGINYQSETPRQYLQGA